MGNFKFRDLLIIRIFKVSKVHYERLVAKGKSKKLALITVCNKLLKQAFGILKSGLPYDENFVSKLS